MGAWGYRHFDSDDALDWIGANVEHPLALVIKGELQAFLKQKKVRQKRNKPSHPGGRLLPPKGYPGGHAEAVAAAALLDALSQYDTGKEAWICLAPIAEEAGLYSLAVRVVRECLSDEFWLSEWELEAEKRRQLGNLVVSLKRKAQRERGRFRAFRRRRKR
jgi:hypothetical protein